MSNTDQVATLIGYTIYAAQALTALWGAYCVAMVFLRVGQKQFSSEEAQAEFLAELEKPLAAGDFTTAARICEGDVRAVPQLAALAIANRAEGYAYVRQLLLERFQRDVLADLDYRVSWVNTVIKSAPMLGLFGTVVGMMFAFNKLAQSSESVKPEALASDISLALVTTAVGLAIAVPLILCLASVNIQIRNLEDLATAGLTRFFDHFRAGLAKSEA